MVSPVWVRKDQGSCSLEQTRWLPRSVASGDLGEVVAGEVGQLACLDGGPQQFHRVEFGCIGGQPFQSEPVLLGRPGSHVPAPVGGQSVPHQHHRFTGVERFDLFQRLDQGGGVVAAGLEVEAQPRTTPGVAGVVAQGGGHRGAFPVQPVPQDGSAAAGRVGATDLGQQGHARFVEEHDPCTFLHRPFLIRGHSWVTHRRSRTRPARPPAWAAADSAPAARSVIATPMRAPASPRSAVQSRRQHAPGSTDRPRTRAPGRPVPTRPEPPRLGHHPAWAAGQ